MGDVTYNNLTIRLVKRVKADLYWYMQVFSTAQNYTRGNMPDIRINGKPESRLIVLSSGVTGGAAGLSLSKAKYSHLYVLKTPLSWC